MFGKRIQALESLLSYYTSPVDYLVQKQHFAQTILKPKSSAEIFKITWRWFWKSKIAWGHFKSFWQIINTKSHDVIFETRSIWLKLNSGRTIPLSFRGQLGPGAFRPSPALVAPWTRAVSFSPRSISTKYSSAKSQKPLGCASRFLRLPRGILLKTLSTISKTSRLRLEVFEIVSRVLSPYTSRFKNYIVRFHIK